MSSNKFKTCDGCKQELPTDSFYRDSRRPDGLRGRCKACVRLYYEAWKRKTGRVCSSCGVLLAEDRFARMCPDCQFEYHVAHYEQHEEQYRERSREWRKDNRARHREYTRLWAALNPEQKKMQDRVCTARRRVRLSLAGGETSAAVIEQMVMDQDNKCAYCAEELVEQFHIEHMIPVSRGGNGDWTNIAITCQACNLSKGNKTLEEFWLLEGPRLSSPKSD